MSILRKDYEISVWKDTWKSDKFIEERLGIIGSDSMSYEGRAIEPNFSRNVNGVKKLSFKMYKYFVDPVTGEKALNPFVDWLVSERKIKLYYEDKWYDFIIKNIVEDSKNYLYTYQLEDALVQELSKNGFGVTLDMKLNNNMGTANELAAEVLKETDWKVASDSEAFVERVDETLVYVNIKTDTYKGRIKHIIDQDENNRSTGVTFEDADLTGTITALAFYSSCTGKPHRFQFIYLDKLQENPVSQLDVYKDDNRTVAEKNCQYYIDFDSESDYTGKDDNFYLPADISTTTKVEDVNSSATKLSYKYRGERYGFAQQAEYIPVLDRYCNIYETEDKSLYYGYLNADYKSPALTTNLISGSALDSTHGWTGTRYDSNSGDKAVVESVFGYFNNGVFVDSISEIKNGVFDPTDPNKSYESYLKITFPENVSSACVINSCIYDNRTLIGNISRSDQWALKCETLGGPGQLTFKLQECKYDPANDCYDEAKGAGLVFNDFLKEGDYYIARMGNNFAECSEEDFKKNTQARLVIMASAPGDYYIKSISLFKASYANGNLITLEEQGKDLDERVVEKTYYYFSPSALDNITEASKLKPDYTSKTLDYSTYKPVYNTGAEKVRSITAKESNYFNILQSIAETFEAWLLLEVERDELGGIINKSVKFKNYIGKDNYAGFHYGVNLQGIQRTYESKNIVTKLMVKSNSNEYAPNGFCTIQRANANPTGESYIYDFQYYFNRGLMNARDYLETIYIWNDKALGPDIAGTIGLNLQGYYPRIKALNEQIEEKNEILINTAKDIVQYRAELEVATAGVDAASNGLEQVREDFEALTKVGFPTDKAPLSEELGKRPDVQKLLKEYATYYSEYTNYSTKKEKAEKSLDAVQKVYDTIESEIKALKKNKIALNQLFFKQYSRFIQEGTWIDEEYVDDELYYSDALSVLYNSCYPQVAYQINVLELSKLPGYELFKFELGDKTYAEDPEFFGEGIKEEVIITELNENLDDPSKNTVKVQNFKNQFQDLFQKITATVQQAQYRTGSYERAVALAEANNERKNQFLSDALDTANARLTTAGQQSVTWGADGITVQDVDSPSDMIRMVGGAILLSKQDKNGEQKWVTGVTSDGISASLVTAGVVNTGEISIMNYDEPVFRWDSYGISAYDATWEDVGGIPTISEVDSTKFVRFDKNGIYGIDGIDGQSWIPTGKGYDSLQDEIDSLSTFALTWEGLKVTGEDKGTARLGKQSDYIMLVKDADGQGTFGITSKGKIETKGIKIISGTIGEDNQPIASTKDIEDMGASNKGYSEKLAEDLKNELQPQIDGTITSWFKIGYPMPNIKSPDGNVAINESPADEWIEKDKGKEEAVEQIKHEGDLYYDRDTGFCYRWIYDDGSRKHCWILIKDTEVTKALKDAAEAQATADNKMHTFVGDEPPKPPYQIGDIWVNATCEGYYKNDLLRCCKEKKETEQFHISDWTLSSKYTDDSALITFKNGEYADEIKEIYNQVDKKSDIYYQPKDPAEYSGEMVWGKNRVGDLWRCTTTSDNYQTQKSTSDNTLTVRKTNSEWVWKEFSTNEYGWQHMEIPDNIFDAYDGKCSLYLEKPTNYKAKDLWILDKQGKDSKANNYDSTYPPYEVGSLLVAKSNSPYDKSHWVEEVKYTDQLNEFKNAYNQFTIDINSQLDKKAETWYTNSDPSDNWKDDEAKEIHVGDLWHFNSKDDVSINGIIRKAHSEWIWQKNTDGTYGWLEMKVPDEVFDKIDNKSNIFTSIPDPDKVQINDGDILIPSVTSGVYATGKVYRYNSISKTWNEIEYTDDTELNNFINNKYNKFVTDIKTQVDGKAGTWYQSSNPANNWEEKDYEDYAGDLWHDTTNNKEYIWYLKDGQYQWVEMAVPDEVFDTIDGIASIYTSIPSKPNIGDLYIPDANNGDYKIGKVYKYNGSQWIEINYTDDTTVNNLEIGGRNLLIGITKKENWSGYNDFNNGELTKISSLSTESYLNFSGKPTLEKGKQYTLSFEAKGTSNLSSTEVFFLQEDWTSTGIYTYGTGGITLTTGYKKYSFTFYPNADPQAKDPKKCEIRFDHNGSTNGANATLWIRNIKLEKGGKATDWTIAPEDIEETIEELKKKAEDAVHKAAEGISLADGAKILANTANETANTANETANTAKDTANQANDTANAAKQYAESEVSKLDSAVKNYLGLNEVLQGPNFIVSPYIGGGYLNITSTTDKAKVIIDPNNLTNQTKRKLFQVYDKDETFVMGIDDDGNAYFKGNITAGGGNIAGWTIAEDSITIGSMGINGFHMFSQGQSYTGTVFGQTGKTWALGIGNNFGVTSDGALYASKGKIGTMEIEALSSIRARNLIPDSKGPFYINTEKSNIRRYLTTTLSPGEKYTFTIKNVTSSTSIRKFKVQLARHTGYNDDGGETYTQVAPTYVFGNSNTNPSGDYTHTFNTHTGNNFPTGYDKYRIAIHGIERDETISDSVIELSFESIKLEKGTVATEWCAAEEDAMNSNVNTNNFSWKFSNSEGMLMWNGEQGNGEWGNDSSSDQNLVFKIGKDQDEDHQLYIRGYVNAEAGYIGNIKLMNGVLSTSDWLLDENKLEFKSTGLLKFGSTFFGCQSEDENDTQINVGGKLTIQDSSETKMVFGANRTNQTIELKQEYKRKSSSCYLRITLKSNWPSIVPLPLTVYWHMANKNKESKDQSGSFTFTIVKNTYTYEKEFSVSKQSADQFFGFSFANADQAKSRARHNIEGGGNGYGINLGGGEWLDISESSVVTKSIPYSSGSEQTITVQGAIYTSSSANISYTIGTGNAPWNAGYFDKLYCSNGYPQNSSSDERIKNSIEAFPIKYERFFDELLPKRYKYNNGTSNRYHTGFIAQDVVRSLNSNDITTQEFAGVMLDNPGQENECWYLRRDEFVALNTWQIQKLKPRVSALEQTILNYETRISNLENEIQNLKNS